MVDRPHMQVDRLHRAKRPLHFGQIFVGSHRVLRRKYRFLDRSANHVQAIQRRLFRNPRLVATIGELLFLDLQKEVFANLVVIEHLAHA